MYQSAGRAFAKNCVWETSLWSGEWRNLIHEVGELTKRILKSSVSRGLYMASLHLCLSSFALHFIFQTPHVVFTGVDGEKLKESSQHSLPAFLLAHSTVLAKSLNLSEVLILHLLNEHNYVCRFANNTGKSLLQHEKWL